MTPMIKKASLLGWIILGLFTGVVEGQVTPAAKTSTNQGALLLTADSLASGNYKDIFSSFFQLAFENLTGPNKELKFTTNPYAIMLRQDSTLARDAAFQRLRPWRKLNFTLDAKLDTAFNFNGLGVGVTYALYDGRDITVSKLFAQKALADSNDNEFADLAQVVSMTIQRDSTNPARDTLLLQEAKASRDTTLTFDKLDPRLQKVINDVLKADTVNRFIYVKRALAGDPKMSLAKNLNKTFNKLVNEFQNRPLWTVSAADTSYKTGLFSKSVQFMTEYMQGILDPNDPVNLEIDGKVSYSFLDDTTHPGMNLKRQVFNITPGVNLVVKGGQTQQPWLEFMLSGSYSNICKGALYKGENQITNTINGQLSLRVFKDIWVPLQISYDPKMGNVFGFLDVKTNFTALGNLFKGGNSASAKL